MNLERSFTVSAPAVRVWETLTDVAAVAPCLPGAEITEVGDDGTHRGTFTVKLGPTTASYNGVLKVESLDADAYVATMSARGTDKRGQGGMTATIVSTMHEENGVTSVHLATDFAITGRLARFGRSGMIEDISNRLLRDFSACLEKKIGGLEPSSATPPQSVGGLELFLGVLWDGLRRLLGRGR